MTASLNAAASSSHLAPIRDGRELKAGSSSPNRESFSQVLRRTAGEQKASGVNRKSDTEKGNSKAAKKDDDANTTAPATAGGNAIVIEKSALPITFLFGLPVEQQPQSSGAEDGSDAPSSSQVGEKAASSNQLLPVSTGVFPSRMVAENDGPVPLTTGTVSFNLPDDLDAQKGDAGPGTANDVQLAVESSGNKSRGAAAALSANTLAFAMRLGSGETVTASKAPGSVQAASSPDKESTQSNAGGTMPGIVQAASASDLEQHSHQQDPSAEDQHVLDLTASAAPERFDPAKISKDNPTAPAAAVQVPADPPATAEPVRNVHMQLVGDDNRRVDVRLIDRGGELHVSVKSADPALTQNLQDHLPDLTARLDKQHMQSEVWVPKAAEATKAEGGSTNGSLSDSNARSYSGNSDGRKHGRQQERPDWVDALESYT